jgi:hypothetical protein
MHAAAGGFHGEVDIDEDHHQTVSGQESLRNEVGDLDLAERLEKRHGTCVAATALDPRRVGRAGAVFPFHILGNVGKDGGNVTLAKGGVDGLGGVQRGHVGSLGQEDKNGCDVDAAPIG